MLGVESNCPFTTNSIVTTIRIKNDFFIYLIFIKKDVEQFPLADADAGVTALMGLVTIVTSEVLYGASRVHFDFISPLPGNTFEVLSKFKKVLVCELNSGQFAGYLRAVLPQFSYLQYNKVQGQPFLVSELVDAIKKEI